MKFEPATPAISNQDEQARPPRGDIKLDNITSPGPATTWRSPIWGRGDRPQTLTMWPHATEACVPSQIGKFCQLSQRLPYSSTLVVCHRNFHNHSLVSYLATFSVDTPTVACPLLFTPLREPEAPAGTLLQSSPGARS
jgi:hypothetical protein